MFFLTSLLHATAHLSNLSNSMIISWEAGSKERELDIVNFNTVIPCVTKSSIEAQFQHVYTQEKFRKVNCITRLTQSSLGYMVSNSIFNKFAVTYNTISSEVKCQCLLFESRGILCRHSLSALRFDKNVKRRHTHIKSSHNKPLLEPRSRRFDNFIFRSQNICEFTSESKELTGILHHAYDNAMVEMQEYKAKSKEKYSLSHGDTSLEDINKLQSPPWIANAAKKKKKKALSEWFSGVVKFQPLSWTYYELSV
ncbi:hypothetical protein Ahy_A04g018684 [Arachis hypogaea]|uniref:Protein FAR1-RELATED SEQUENCE n=1 Tax=Arachis hypogaea TaxID=3818 RepID=A0A445DEA3_ARAHY|nr:hypothetical protein Ahy_A04g018684 [Arachis hypogaea]